MRLIYTIEDQNKGQALSAYLVEHGIENQLELTTNTDWGSPEYGTVSCKLWVYDEDHFEEAMQLVDEFDKDPSKINSYHMEPSLSKAGLKIEPVPLINERQPMGKVTLYLLIICTLLLVIASLTSPLINKTSSNLPYTPIAASPIYKTLMYDYPEAFEIIDRIIALYGIDTLQDPNALPKEGQYLLQKFYKTPYWRGIYDQLRQHYKTPAAPWNFNAPMFEKIKQGEIWRVFTPCLLHSDLLHLLFNMLWLAVLGKQLEQRLKTMRYCLFILITAIISNTAQYLMSGSAFLGFSGVLCAMIAFVWMRQRCAAWEGYQLERSTIGFIAFFILFMFSIQVISFFLEAHSETFIPISLANTAHLTGAFSGYCLAKTRYFAWHAAR